jgi:hypothetical protein
MIRIRVIFDLLELPIKVSNGTEIKSVTLSHIDFDLEQFLLFLLLRFHKEKNMKRRNKIVLLILMVFTFIPVSSFAAETTGVDSKNYDWNPVMDAIIQVESHGNIRAKRGSSVGAMQITPILVVECNQILKKRKSKKRYKLSDRFSLSKSKEMFLLIQSYYNPFNNIEKAVRLWNGGLNFSIQRTQRYFEKVMNLLKN